MEAILPFKIKNEHKFYESALKVGYNEMEIYKFIYVMQQSDLDIFPKMHDERINVLIYGWELCEDYKQKLNPNEWELPEEMETILKLLVPWSMDIWFSKEWDKCKYLLKSALIHCLNRARDLLMRMPDMMQINWDFLLLYNLKPWNVLYLKNLTVTKEKTLENGAESIETEEVAAIDEDISYVKLEQLPIIVLRLVKIFDQYSIDMVKTLCMRVIAAWNKIHQTELETSGSRRPYIPPEDKKCLMLICHIYLMAVYEADDVKGYVIDNMINNIRFYYQGFQNSTPLHAMDNLEYTPARYIALTNFHLRVQKRDFFDFFIWNKYDTSLVNLFGVVSQAYKSYLLGNLLMELNNMNEDDFASNIPLYKRLMNSYVNEREKSEIFLLSELEKIEAQRYAHNIIQTVKNVTDFKSKICKGNRMSNIGNYENSDDTVAPLVDINILERQVDEKKEEVVEEDIEYEQERTRNKESELRLDPIFQNLPNNESILYYVYDVLARKDYKGWHFAKVVLLVKIIGCEQNMVETWRYHPGLTTDFMLNLEVKLSRHYVDLAKIFRDHPFLEQEFWLTAFYLNPTSELYETIKRLGMRNNRKRTDEHTKLVMSIDNIDAKYGLLSSTIDVKELALMSNTDDPITDYEPLFSALHSLRVPDSLVKDMLTAIFLPRNRSFAWAVDWVILRNRCKMIMTNLKEKKRFVDLNMAEANERLKYLIIDYEKYKNRPQLDYGTIEEGYENLMGGGEFDKESEEEEEEEEEEDFEDDEDVYESKKKGKGSMTAAAQKKENEKEDENSQEDDPFLMGKRRTRARTAATLASFLFQTLPRSSRRKKNQKPSDDEAKSDDEKTATADHDDKSSDSKSPIPRTGSRILSPLSASCNQEEISNPNVPTKNIKESLKERPVFLNTTSGFQNLIDIWNVEKSDLQLIDENCVSLMESSTALEIAVKLKLLNKEINPLGCDENEYIDDKEMIIHNVEYAIKKENTSSATDLEEILDKIKERNVAMEIEDHDIYGQTKAEIEENVELELQLSRESPVEKVTEHKIAEVERNKELTSAGQNAIEIINLNMSTAAEKISSNLRGSNIETTLKQYDINNDIQTEDKTLQTKNSRELSEGGTLQTTMKHLEIEKINQKVENDLDKFKNEINDVIDTKMKTDENASKDSQILEEPFATLHENMESDNHNGSKRRKLTGNYLEKSEINQIRVDEDSDNFTNFSKDSNNTEENTIAEKCLNTKKTVSDNQLKNLEEAKNSEKLLTDRQESLEKESNNIQRRTSDTKLFEITAAENKETLEKINAEKLNEKTKRKSSDIDAKAVAVKSNETNNSNIDTIPKHHKEHILDTNETKSHKPSETYNKIKIVTDNCKKVADTRDDQKRVQPDDSRKIRAMNYQEKFEEIYCKKATDLLNNQTKLFATNSHSSTVFLDDINRDSTNIIEDQESTDEEVDNLKKLCLTRPAQILINKLRPQDLINLRQPKIIVQRICYEKYAAEMKSKRRCIEGKVYMEYDDSSNSNNSTNTSSSEAYRPIRLKRKIPKRRHSTRQLRTSESDNDSNNSDDYKLSSIIAKGRKRRLSIPSTSQSSTSQHVTGPKSIRKSGPKSACLTPSTGPKSSTKHLVVTPRSASGLKLRIFNAEQNQQETETSLKESENIVYDEIIQLSSSSSDAYMINDLTIIEEEIIEIDDNPLFEEEIVI